MSDGKKFTKTDSNLSPEDRLADVERNYSVILQRIQAYDKVLDDFSLIKSELSEHKKGIKDLASSFGDFKTETKSHSENVLRNISESKKNHEHASSVLDEHSKAVNYLSDHLRLSFEKISNEMERIKNEFKRHEIKHSSSEDKLDDLDNVSRETKGFLSNLSGKIDALQQAHENLKVHSQSSHNSLSSEMGKLLNSIKEMPEFNEWATKIYIRVCNEINDKQKQLYNELDKKCQQLKEQLSADPYTADSVKKMLQGEMDNLAMDGRNAYIKATNAAQQMQLLEKKVENINLILKKYELNR